MNLFKNTTYTLFCSLTSDFILLFIKIRPIDQCISVSHFLWQLQKGKHFNLSLAHLQFLHRAFWQVHILHISEILGLPSIWYCHFGKYFPFVTSHPQNSGFWYCTFVRASDQIHPACNAALFTCSVRPSREGGMTRRLESDWCAKWLSLSTFSFPRFFLCG